MKLVNRNTRNDFSNTRESRKMHLSLFRITTVVGEMTLVAFHERIYASFFAQSNSGSMRFARLLHSKRGSLSIRRLETRESLNFASPSPSQSHPDHLKRSFVIPYLSLHRLTRFARTLYFTPAQFLSLNLSILETPLLSLLPNHFITLPHLSLFFSLYRQIPPMFRVRVIE